MARLKWLLALGVSALPLAPAFAQRADEEVVVTAPLEGARIESLQGAEVLDREQILERLTGNLGDLLIGVPGVSSTAYGAGAGRPIIRGLGDDRIRVLENGIGTIDASSASPDHAVGADPLDARRVEVLRGAAALAYGGNAVGGVVNVIDETIATRLPERGWSASALAAYTSVDEGWQGALGASAVAGDVVFGFDIAGRETEDYAIPGFARSAELRAADPLPDEPFGHAPNSFTSVRSYAGGLSLVKDWGFVGVGAKRYETSYGLPPHDADEPAGHIELEQTRYETRGDIALGGPVFTRLDFAGQIADYTHTEFEGSGEPGTIFNNDGFEGRLELHNGGDGALNGATGIQFSHTDFEAIGAEAFLSPTETRDIGLFTVQRWDRDSWGLEGGLRLEQRQLDNDVHGQRDFTTLSGALGAFLRPADGWFAGVTLARTERAPTGTELFADGPHLATAAYEVGDPNLDIETATSLEGSLRFESDAWRFELSAYVIGFDGYIALVPTGREVEFSHDEEHHEGEDEEAHEEHDHEHLPEFAFVQRDATFTGGEISVWARLGTAGGWTFSADAAADIVHAEFDSNGGYIPRIPPSTVTLGLNAESEAWGARIELVDIARQDDTAAFETATDGSTVLNARLAWRPVAGEDVIVLLDGRNLTDEEVRIHASFLKDDLPRPGRSIRVAISARY